MIRKGLFAVVAGLSVAGCANDTLAPSASLNMHSLNLITGSTQMAEPGDVSGARYRPASASGRPVDLARDKTMAGKVLTAIALERVTGRKPDPATLSAVY